MNANWWWRIDNRYCASVLTWPDCRWHFGQQRKRSDRCWLAGLTWQSNTGWQRYWERQEKPLSVWLTVYLSRAPVSSDDKEARSLAQIASPLNGTKRWWCSRCVCWWCCLVAPATAWKHCIGQLGAKSIMQMRRCRDRFVFQLPTGDGERRSTPRLTAGLEKRLFCLSKMSSLVLKTILSQCDS